MTNYSKLINSIDEGFCLIQILFDADNQPNDWRYLYVNDIFAELTTLRDAQGKLASEVLPSIEPFWLGIYSGVALTGEPAIATEHVAQVGRWFEVRAVSMDPPERHIVAVMFNNVSLYKQTEYALRESEARLRTMIRNLPGGFAFIIDRELRFTLADGDALYAAGFQPSDVIGKHVDVAPYPERISAFVPLLRQALAGATFSYEHDSHGRSFFTRGIPLRDPYGSVNAVLALSSDITERKRAEERLRERESRFAAIFSSIDEGFCLAEMILDADGRAVDYRFLETNPLFEAMTGLVDARGRTAYELVPNLEPHWVETYARVALGGETLRFENGSEAMERWFDVFATPVEPRGRFALVFKDVTERKRIEEERIAILQREQAARLEAERATDMQRRFLGMVSHELRTPLASIKGFSSSLIADDVEFSTDETKEFLRVIDEEADKLTELIDQLLSVVRLQAGMLAVDPIRTSLEAIIDRAAPQLRTLTKQHRLDIRLGDDDTAFADVRRIAQVLVNLVDNAVKFAPLMTTVTISSQRLDDQLKVTVSDQGVGIPASERDDVFESFHQVVSERGRQRGAGLGLAICKGLVEAHGGRIWVEETSNTGCAIAFTLPRAASTP